MFAGRRLPTLGDLQDRTQGRRAAAEGRPPGGQHAGAVAGRSPSGLIFCPESGPISSWSTSSENTCDSPAERACHDENHADHRRDRHGGRRPDTPGWLLPSGGGGPSDDATLTYEDSPLSAYWEKLGGSQDEAEDGRPDGPLRGDRGGLHAGRGLRVHAAGHVGDDARASTTATTACPRGTRSSFAEQYGYGATTSQDMPMNQGDGEEWVDPNADYVATMSETEQAAFYEALYGPQTMSRIRPTRRRRGGGLEYDWTTAGCRARPSTRCTRQGQVWDEPEFKDLMDGDVTSCARTSRRTSGPSRRTRSGRSAWRTRATTSPTRRRRRTASTRRSTRSRTTRRTGSQDAGRAGGDPRGGDRDGGGRPHVPDEHGVRASGARGAVRGGAGLHRRAQGRARRDGREGGAGGPPQTAGARRHVRGPEET